jgi:hypothetical protein
VVVNCKNVNSPNPEESEANDIPNNRGESDFDKAIVTIPSQLHAVQKNIRRLYRI